MSAGQYASPYTVSRDPCCSTCRENPRKQVAAGPNKGRFYHRCTRCISRSRTYATRRRAAARLGEIGFRHARCPGYFQAQLALLANQTAIYGGFEL